MTQNNANKRLEDIPIPFNDVKNILEEIHFEDELTRSRCRGWLVLPSRRYLQADILFPGCELTADILSVDEQVKFDVIYCIKMSLHGLKSCLYPLLV